MLYRLLWTVWLICFIILTRYIFLFCSTQCPSYWNNLPGILFFMSIILLFSFGLNFFNVRRYESQVLLNLFIACCQKKIDKNA
jgi:hypothetical protein